MDLNGGLMKRMLIGLLLAGACLLCQAQNTRAAQTQAEDLSCGGYKDKITFMDGVPDTVGIRAHAEKIAPSNPIVIGQDKEEKRGVDISVTIGSLPGTAEFWRWHQYEVGTHQVRIGDPIPRGEDCRPSISGYRECYTVDNRCEKETETVYRKIIPDSVSVWLDPSTETEQFLGWGPTHLGRYPLRYLFPEKWALGAWTPTGLEQESIGEWYPEGSEVWAFGQENSWFTFLFPDPNEIDLPGQHLLRLSQPQRELGYMGRRILGLYGRFYTFQAPYSAMNGTSAGECLVDSGRIADSSGLCFVSKVGTSTEATYFSINFTQIPLDLPGTWRIGMMASQLPAMYDHGKLTENLEGEAKKVLDFGPQGYGWGDASYDIDDYYFYSYVVISTPCYETDPKSCMN
jgi:hypothetical protein